MNFVKGVAIKNFAHIIGSEHKNDGLKLWMDTLTPDSRKIFSEPISSKEWYPLEESLIAPTATYCMLFHNFDFHGAWIMGKHSAEYGLKGIYKFFIKRGSPEFLVKKAGTILPSYYKQSVIKVIELKKNMTVLEINNFPNLNKIIEFRICGWMERALEICGVTNIKLELIDSVEQTMSFARLQASWTPKT